MFLARKICKFDFREFCLYPSSDSCSVFDPSSGCVSLCRLYRGGERDASRKICVDLGSPFSKHLRRKGSGVFG